MASRKKMKKMNSSNAKEVYDESEFFKLQADELLKNMIVEAIPEEWLCQFNNFLKNIPETSSQSIDDFSLDSVQLPMMKKKKGKGSFKFLPPECISAIGSFQLGTVCSTPTGFVFDIAVEIPKGCWQGMDFLNERYHRKRSLYLAYIAQYLQNADFVADLQFTYQNDCHLKPILQIIPKGVEDKIVSLTAYPSEKAFKASRFIPERNNVRSSWFLDNSEDDLDVPTPYYNATILADLELVKLNNYLKENISEENVKNGIKLIKLWLMQRGLLSGYGRLNGFIITMFVVYLLKKQKINGFMNPYQIVRCTLLALKHENFAEGITLGEKNDQFSLSNKYFPGVFLEESGFLNFLYCVNKETLDMVKHEATLAINMLEDDVPNSFFMLFTRNISPLEKFEYLVHLKGPKNFRNYALNLCSDQDCLNFGENKIAAVVPKICDILRKGLNERILLLDVISSTSTWPVSNKPVSPNCNEVTIGVLLNPDVPLSNIEKGPLADDPEAKEFRKFWGDQSEMRRFQDGTIREAVYWPADTFEDKRKVFSQMIKDILKRHLNVEEKHLIVNGCEVDHVLHLPKDALPSSLLPYGTGEEAHVALMKVFNSLSQLLRKLDGLPLQITSVQGISPAFRYTEVFPPLPVSSADNISINPSSMHERKRLKRDDSRLPPFIPALNVVIELEKSGKWPNDVVGIRKLKTAFYIKLAEILNSQYSLLSVPFLTYTDVVKEGFVFRLLISNHKELHLLTLHTLPNGMVKEQETDESKELKLTIDIYPKLNGLLHGIQMQHLTYGTSCRLAKRWVAAQLKDTYVKSIDVELLVAHVYVHPQPFTAPSSPQTGFIRFLSLLINYNWNFSPVIVNFNNVLEKTKIDELEKTLCAFVVVAPLDGSGGCYKSHINKNIIKRLNIFSNAALSKLKQNLSSDIKVIFRPPLSCFDVIINLNHSIISKTNYAVDIKTTFRQYADNNGEYPSVEFDMPKAFFEELKETYGEFAFFFYDVYGGDFIGLIWKKSAFVPKELKTSHLNCCKLKHNDSVFPCRQVILEDFKILGKNIIKSVIEKK